jgi:hypothetical protein
MSMKNLPRILILTAAAGLCASTAFASDDSTLRFEGGIGATPVGRINNNGTATPTSDDFPEANTVLDVAPGGAPWTIRSLRARIDSDGRISAKGEGLLLAGGNNIGTRGGPRQVLASLFCRAAPVAPTTTGAAIGPFNSEFVDLDANGDFEIRGSLTDSAGAAPPEPCGDATDNRPVLLIRTVAGGAPGAWFASGILRGRGD